jgi:hypothetical protein
MNRLVVGVLASSLLACGGSNPAVDAGSNIDAGSNFDAGTADAGTIADAGVADAGQTLHYVLDTMLTPLNNSEASAFSLDLDQDGVPDNQFGSVAATFTQQGLDFRAPIEKSVADGTAITLLSVSATSAVRTFVGTNPRPAACVDQNDTVCGRHLDGGAAFDVVAGTASDMLVGTFANGTVRTAIGGGQVQLRLSLLGSAPTLVHLQHARMSFTGAGSNRLSMGVLAGGLTTTERDDVLYPAMATALTSVITRDCSNTTPPGCGCMASTSGATYVQLFDTTPDCRVTAAELKTNGLLQSTLVPDVMIDGVPLISFGVSVSAVSATFTE